MGTGRRPKSLESMAKQMVLQRWVKLLMAMPPGSAMSPYRSLGSGKVLNWFRIASYRSTGFVRSGEK